jgi:hypothetical protein
MIVTILLLVGPMPYGKVKGRRSSLDDQFVVTDITTYDQTKAYDPKGHP